MFNSEQFSLDVEAYCELHKINTTDLGRRSGLGESLCRMILTGRRDVGLLSACALATVCGLSLDAYRLDLVDIGGKQ